MRIVDGGHYCWEKAELPLAIDNAAHNDVTFVQTGYEISLHVSHAAKLVCFSNHLFQYAFATRMRTENLCCFKTLHAAVFPILKLVL